MTLTISAELQGRRLLVVEDDYFIACDLVQELESQGVEVVGPTASVGGATELIGSAELDGAVLDINLGEERVFPVADLLTARGVPFVFATGYDVIVVPPAHANVPRLGKPVQTAALVRLLSGEIERAKAQSC